GGGELFEFDAVAARALNAAADDDDHLVFPIDRLEFEELGEAGDSGGRIALAAFRRGQLFGAADDARAGADAGIALRDHFQLAARGPLVLPRRFPRRGLQAPRPEEARRPLSPPRRRPGV